VHLACAGCGKIDHPKEILPRRMSVADALRAVATKAERQGIHPRRRARYSQGPGADRRRHRARKRFVYLCTNALLLAKHIDEYRPSPYLTFSHSPGRQSCAP